MTTLSVNIRERFTNLRKKLDQLGYLQPLSLDSLPLVESIFTDLLWTTDSFRKNKSELDKKLETRERIEEYIEPYKRDNGRVLAENSRLQKKILDMKIDHEEVTRDLNCRVRQLEDEKEDLSLFSEQCLNKLKKYEVEAKQMVDKIVQLQEKNMQAVVHTSDGKQKSIAFRRQRMDIDHFIPKSTDSSESGNTHGFCCKWAEAHANSSKSVDETGGSSEQSELLNCVTLKCRELTMQLQRAHQEIELNDTKIEGYIHQMKLYEEEMSRLTKELSGGRNLEAMTIEQESKSRERLIEQLNMQLDLLQQRNEELEKEICRTNALNIKEGKTVLSQKELKKDSRIQELDEENKRLRNKIDACMDKERNLLKQINKQTTDKLGNNKNIQQNHQIADLKQHIRKLEDECEYYHKQLDQIEEIGPIKQIADLTNQNQELIQLVEKMQNENNCHLEDQRQFTPPVRDEISTVEESNQKLQNEITRVKKEKNNLQELLNKFERQLHDIQGNIRVLTQERDNINEKYLQSQKESQELRAALLSASSEPNNHMGGHTLSHQQQVLLRRLELERNQAFSDLHRMTTERDSLREQLQASTQTALTQKSRMQQTLEETEEENRILQDKIKKLRIQSGQTDEQLRKLQTKKEELEECLQECQIKLSQNATHQEDYETKIKDAKRKESEALRELEQSEDRIRKLQHCSQEKHEQLQEQAQEISKLKSILAELDREKDQLQNELDQKSEDFLSLQQQFDRKHQNMEELRSQVAQLESQIQRVQQTGNHREQEMRASILQNEQLEHELRRLTKCYDEQRIEMASMNEKMLKLSRENKQLDTEVRDANRNYEEVQQELKSISQKLEQSEKLRLEVQTKYNEVIEQYRELNIERDKCQLQVQQQESRVDEINGEIEAREKVVGDLREQVLAAEREISHLQNALQSSEAQLQNLNCAMQTNQEVVSSQSMEKQQILGELSSMRDLCQRLETAKDQLTRQLSLKLLDMERMNGENAELKRELESAKKECHDLRSSLDNMETMVAVGREKEFRDTMNNQQKISAMESEIEQFRQCKAHVDKLSRDLGQSNSRISELEMENDRLKRQLTSEKFKVEMANQELKRRQQAPNSHRSNYQDNTTSNDTSAGKDTSVILAMHDDGPNKSTRSAHIVLPDSQKRSNVTVSPRIPNSERIHSQEVDDCTGEISKGYTSDPKIISKSSKNLHISTSTSAKPSTIVNVTKNLSNHHVETNTNLSNQIHQPIKIRCSHGCFHGNQCKSKQQSPPLIKQKICAHNNCKHTKNCLNSNKNSYNNQSNNDSYLLVTDNSSVSNSMIKIVSEDCENTTNNNNNDNINYESDGFDATEVSDTLESNSSSGIQTGRSILSNEPGFSMPTVTMQHQRPSSNLETVFDRTNETSSSINNQNNSLATVTMSSVVANSNQYHQSDDDESEL